MKKLLCLLIITFSSLLTLTTTPCIYAEDVVVDHPAPVIHDDPPVIHNNDDNDVHTPIMHATPQHNPNKTNTKNHPATPPAHVTTSTTNSTMNKEDFSLYIFVVIVLAIFTIILYYIS